MDTLGTYNPPDPEFRKHESARQWLTKYYYFRQNQLWKVESVNKTRLNFRQFGFDLRINYHIFAQQPDKKVFYYLKFGKDWEEYQIISTLSMIRSYVESEPQSLEINRNTNVEYTYHNLKEDSEIVLSDADYLIWNKAVSENLKRITQVLTPTGTGKERQVELPFRGA